MSTKVHFIDVGAGNMILIQTDNKKNILFDCNVTEENEEYVLDYLQSAVGSEGRIDLFICSHRDADHIRGIGKIYKQFRIHKVCDSGRATKNTTSKEYRTYMKVRKKAQSHVLTARQTFSFGSTELTVIFAGDGTLPNDPNTQSIVLKVTHNDSASGIYGSILLTGDSDITSWRDNIMENYKPSCLSSDILLASHHGSYSFFGDSDDEKFPYLAHIDAISPCLTVISTDGETHNHPNQRAESLYKENSIGARNGERVVRTDIDGTMKLVIGYSDAPIDTGLEQNEEEGFEGETLLPKSIEQSNILTYSTDWRLFREKEGE